MSTPSDQTHVSDIPGGVEAALEAVLIVATEPVPTDRLAGILGVTERKALRALESLARAYDERAAGFDLREGPDGWRFYTARRFADVVARYVRTSDTARLSQAALETLAVVAYRQPVTRSQIAAIRGVNVDGVMRTLLIRGLVTETSQDPVTGANFYGTTGEFLDRMGWQSLDDLPPISPHLPDLDDVDEV